MAMYGGSNQKCPFIHYHFGIPVPVSVPLSCRATADSPPAAAATTSSGEVHKINFNGKPDEFLMYRYKVKRCTKIRRHDWIICPYAHPLEKARRRDPKKYPYTGIACPDFWQRGECQRGENCEYAHGVFEFWLHPTRFRTRVCGAGDNCTRHVCFFAHTLEQLRPVVIRDCFRCGIGPCAAKPSCGVMPAVGAAADSYFSSFQDGMNGDDGNGLVGTSFYSSSFQAGINGVNGNGLVGGGGEWFDYPDLDWVEDLLAEEGEGVGGRGAC